MDCFFHDGTSWKLYCWEKNPYNTPQSPYSMFIIAIQWDTFVVRIYKFALFLSDRGFANDGFPKGLLSREGNSQSWRVIHYKEEDTWMISLWWEIHVTWDSIMSALYALSMSKKTMNLVLSLVSKWRRYLFIQISIGINCTLYLGLWIYLV